MDPAPELDAAARLMAEHGITFNGRHFQYRSHRSALLSDAVTYAISQHSLGAPPRLPAEAPTRAQLEVMSRLGIVFRYGIYHAAGYTYDRLADALEYATP